MTYGMIAVGISSLLLVLVYAKIIGSSFASNAGSGSKLTKILVAAGFTTLVLGLFICGFLKKPQTLLNIFNFLSGGLLAAAYMIKSLKGE